MLKLKNEFYWAQAWNPVQLGSPWKKFNPIQGLIFEVLAQNNVSRTVGFFFFFFFPLKFYILASCVVSLNMCVSVTCIILWLFTIFFSFFFEKVTIHKLNVTKTICSDGSWRAKRFIFLQIGPLPCLFINPWTESAFVVYIFTNDIMI